MWAFLLLNERAISVRTNSIKSICDKLPNNTHGQAIRHAILCLIWHNKISLQSQCRADMFCLYRRRENTVTQLEAKLSRNKVTDRDARSGRALFLLHGCRPFSLYYRKILSSGFITGLQLVRTKAVQCWPAALTGSQLLRIATFRAFVIRVFMFLFPADAILGKAAESS